MHTSLCPSEATKVAPSALMRADDKGFAFESMGALTSFKFTRKTGLFSGNAKIGFANGKTVSGKFKGVLLPGWFGQCDECGEPVPGGLVTRPFASGLFWFKGKVGGKRVTRSLSVDIDSYVAE